MPESSAEERRHQQDHRTYWDLYAPSYDAGTLASDSYVRQSNLEILREVFSPGQVLLEIGGGTGTEAVAMQAHGCRVLLTDNSWRMLQEARLKLGPQAWIVQLPAENIGSLRTTFHGAYASFGVVNCLKDLAGFFRRLHGLLHPGARLVVSFGNRWYLGDVVLFALRRNNFLRRRWSRDFAVSLQGTPHAARARPLSFRQVRAAAQPHFSPLRCIGLPVLLPPPYLERRRRPGHGLLMTLEGALRESFPFRLLGDQTVVVFERSRIP